MKPTIISLFLLLLVSGATTSCDKDEPDGKSIFVDPAEEKTEFDFWLDRHYTEPYNIRFEYRMPTAKPTSTTGSRRRPWTNRSRWPN